MDHLQFAQLMKGLREMKCHMRGERVRGFGTSELFCSYTTDAPEESVENEQTGFAAN